MSHNVPPPHPDNVVQWVTVRLHQDGAVSTQGTIGDKKMAIHLLDIARDAIRGQVPEEGKLFIPNRDVEVMPSLPTRDMGNIPIGERGDP